MHSESMRSKFQHFTNFYLVMKEQYHKGKSTRTSNRKIIWNQFGITPLLPLNQKTKLTLPNALPDLDL